MANCFTCKTANFTAMVNELGDSVYSRPFEDVMRDVNEPIMFFGALIIYFAAVLLQFVGAIFKKEKVLKIAWIVFVAGFAVNSLYMLVRGIMAHRLPLSNQFEFATAFAWGVALLPLIAEPPSIIPDKSAMTG